MTVLFVIAVLLNTAHVLSIPGISLTSYCEISSPGVCTSNIDVFSGRLSSPLLFGPFLPSQFDQCLSGNSTYTASNLGAELFGEVLTETNIKFQFKTEKQCVEICRKTYDLQDTSSLGLYRSLLQGIKRAYFRYWVSDNIPVITCRQVESGEVCERSFPLGCLMTDSKYESPQCNVQFPNVSKGSMFIFNHFEFNITYTESAPLRYYITAVRVTPMSVAHDPKHLKCVGNEPLALTDVPSKPLTIVYTYSVRFYEEKAGASLGNRWSYLISEAPHSSIQWVSITNSVLVVFFLTVLVAIVFMRTLRRDFVRYDKLDSEGNEVLEEFGWKLIHGDVFRAPRHPLIFAVVIGSGVQVGLTSVFTLLLACLGVLSPLHRGAFATCAIAVFVCLGSSAGYTSARLYKFFGGVHWKTNILLTGLFCPGVVMGVFLVVNLVLVGINSSTAVAFTTILSVLAMWLLVSLPLCFLGACFGFRQKVIEVPTRTNQIPRQVPEQEWYTRPLPSALMAGLLPFGCIFIQLFFVFSSIWGQQLYFMFGFLFLACAFLLASVVEVVLLICYFQLCAENYRWWWRSFICGGSTALYIFCHGLHYYIFKTHYQGFTSFFLYLTCTGLVSALLFIMLGSIGFLACFLFIRKIYGLVKVD